MTGFIKAIQLFSIIRWLAASIATGADFKEFRTPQEPFGSQVEGLSQGLREAMLPTLNGVYDSERSQTVYRITEIGDWGINVYTLFFNEELEPFLLTHSRRQAEDKERKFFVMTSIRLPIDTGDKRDAVGKFNWNLYFEKVDQVKSGKVKLIGGDDVPFLLIERIGGEAGYGGTFLQSNAYAHFEDMQIELAKIVLELRKIESIRKVK